MLEKCGRLKLLDEATNWWLDLQDYCWPQVSWLDERQCRDAKRIDDQIDELFVKANGLKCECCPEHFDRAS
jgi:hypothetical protein